MIRSPVKMAQKRFTLTEVYIQQRDGKGANKGDKIYLKRAKSPPVSESVAEDVLLPVVQSINIHEDMKSPSLKGKMNFIDRMNLVEELKLSPLDLLYISMKEEETHLPPLTPPRILTLTFSITSIAQLTQEMYPSMIGPNSHAREVQIEFCSNEHYILNYSYFDYMDEDFVGPISGKNGLVQYISDKVFKEKGTPFSTAKTPIKSDETSNYIYLKKYHNFYPWGKPTFPPMLSSLMQMLIEHSVDKNNPNAANFMFWQNLDGWNFRSIESIIEEYEKPVVVYRVTSNTDDPARILSFEFNVNGDVETDFFELIKDGAFGSNYLFVEPKYDQDPYARYLDTSDSHEIKQINYEYIKDHEKWSKIESLPVLDSTEYIPNWNKNRQYDQFYGYFNLGFFNREKKVKWEYYGYSYSNRQEDTLWQTVFDITDMDGEILRKIQKEIKEPLAKHRKEYAKKMNLKEKWKVYRCSVCCAGLMNEGMTGNTLTQQLSTYEIVAAGSFTDVLNYDASKKIPNSTNPFERSGITLSYDLNEYPYNLSLGDFFNLEQNPDIFTKYRFDLEIKRCEKLLEILEKNIQARQNRINQYNIIKNYYTNAWQQYRQICSDSSCTSPNCTCPSEDPLSIKQKIDSIIEDHHILKNTETNLLELQSPVSIQATIERLNTLKQEFQNLYESYWNRRAFFFSKNIDYSFLKSGNNLFNIKSIKRMPIRGSRYEKFATRKAFPGYTLENGSTFSYDYSVSKDLCSSEEDSNPYYNQKYSTTDKADFWESFENPLSKFPYTQENKPPKGPIWYKNWKVKYKYSKVAEKCVEINSDTSCCTGLVDVCRCTCFGSRTQKCNPLPQVYYGSPICSEFGEEGEDYVFGACSDLIEVDPTVRTFAEQCDAQLTEVCIIDYSPGDYEPIPFCANGFGGMSRPGCCSPIPYGPAEQPFSSVLEMCQVLVNDFWCNPASGDYSFYILYAQANCDEVLGGGSSSLVGSSDTMGSSNPDQQSLVGDGQAHESCNINCSDYYTSEQEMFFEQFSNQKNNPNFTNPLSVYYYAQSKLEGACNADPTCYSIFFEFIDITAVDDEPKLLHPWAADELEPDFNNDDYIEYKKSASLFNDDLANAIPPGLVLEANESYVRVEFSSPIGLELLQEFPEGFINTPGSEYFLPYIVLLTAGPFGTESAKANVSVIGQDPYGFDIAVKKIKNKDDFAKMNLHDSGADSSFIDSCTTFSTASSWLKQAQNIMFYKPNATYGDVFVPVGIQDIFAASSLQRSSPVKTWWDLWISLPPMAMSTYYNRLKIDDSQRGRIPFYKEGTIAGQPDVVTYPTQGSCYITGWPMFILPKTENIVVGAYPGNAAIMPSEFGSTDELAIGDFDVKIGSNYYIGSFGKAEKILQDDPSNVNYYFADFPNVREINSEKQYPVISYPVGTMIYGGSGFTVGQVWKYDTSRFTEYGIVQLSSDSFPSIIGLMGGIGANIQDLQKYNDWINNKLVDWYQNTIFDNNFSAQFVVFSKQSSKSCEDYPCSNPEGFIDNSNCPANDPLCNCPCKEIRPDNIKKVKDRFTGNMIPALTGDFGPEPSSIELRDLKEKTKECTLIKEVLGEEWLGCVWDDPESPYNCSCPCIGKKFNEYMKYNRTQSTFWSTPLHTPLYRNAQMVLLMSNKLKITVPGDLGIKTGQIIAIDGTVGQIKKRYNGKWLVLEIEHLMDSSTHLMNLTLVRDSNADLNKTYS